MEQRSEDINKAIYSLIMKWANSPYVHYVAHRQRG